MHLPMEIEATAPTAPRARRLVIAALTVICGFACVAAAAKALPVAAKAHALTAAPVLRSAAALVVDQDTDEILVAKNPTTVMPIASITKLMTAIVTLDARQSLDEEIVVTPEDRANDGIRSRLVPGTHLTRGAALGLALMASENRAAQLLCRAYPGGLSACVAAMNARAAALGMVDTHFDDPTGLSPNNRASPEDLVRLVKAAYDYAPVREASTRMSLTIMIGKRPVRWISTNYLTRKSDWDIGVQKTGYISAAGRCLVMQAVIRERRVVIVLLDSWGKYSRQGDAQRIRTWLEQRGAG